MQRDTRDMHKTAAIVAACRRVADAINGGGGSDAFWSPHLDTDAVDLRWERSSLTLLAEDIGTLVDGIRGGEDLPLSVALRALEVALLRNAGEGPGKLFIRSHWTRAFDDVFFEFYSQGFSNAQILSRIQAVDSESGGSITSTWTVDTIQNRTKTFRKGHRFEDATLKRYRALQTVNDDVAHDAATGRGAGDVARQRLDQKKVRLFI